LAKAQQATQDIQDQHKTAAADRTPGNKLSDTERQQIIDKHRLQSS
jgi:hypothetical protein